MTASTSQVDRFIRQKSFLISISLMGWWILAAVVAEGIEEISTFLAPSFAILSWLVIRRVLSHSRQWVIFSLLGWFLTFILFRLFDLNNLLYSLVMPGWEAADLTIIPMRLIFATGILSALEWLVIGGLQWVVIRKDSPTAWIWVLLSASAGFVKGTMELWSLNYIDALGSSLIGGLGYGILTSLGFLFLFRFKIQEDLQSIHARRSRVVFSSVESLKQKQ